MQNRKNILLTGTTGLIGGEIALLLARQEHTVWALVRARNEIEGIKRITARFRKSNSGVPGTIIPVCGDITQGGLGIRDRSALSSIRRCCQIIVHAAGATSFRNGQQCCDTNIVGALQILHESMTWVNRARLLFLSTSYVSCSPRRSEISEDMPKAGYANGYIRSKRIAEELVSRSHLNAIILRPSVVIGKGISDRRFAGSILWCIPVATKLGMLPVNKDSQLDIVPVDYVAKCVVEVLNHDIGTGCYNLTAGGLCASSVGDIRDIVHRRTGTRVEFVPNHVWNDVRKKATRGSRQLMSAVEHYVPFINSSVVYSSARIRSVLGKDMPECVPFTEYCASYLDLIRQDEAISESRNP